MQTSIDVDALALRLAAAQPEAALPCPHCAASVKGANLARHFAGVHAGAAAETGSWKGADRAVLPWIGIAAAVGIAASLASFVLAPSYERVVLPTLIVVHTSLVVLGALALFGRLPAMLSLEGDALVLRYALGLARVRVVLPPRAIESGTLLEHRPQPGSSDGPGYDVRAGSYLRLVGASETLTLASKTGTGFRKHWSEDGGSRGGARRRFDVMLAPTALVAVEYLLAERGALKPRA